MADRLLVLVPHEHTHAPCSILEQARKLDDVQYQNATASVCLRQFDEGWPLDETLFSLETLI